MMRLVLVVLLLVLCRGEADAAETRNAHDECELQVAGAEVSRAPAMPAPIPLWGFIGGAPELPLAVRGGPRDLTRHVRAPDGQRSVVPLRSPPYD